VVGIDVARHEAVVSHRVSMPWWDVSSATRSVVAPDGRTLAFTDGAYLALYDLKAGKLTRTGKAKLKALGYSPDGRLRMLT
jgi:uncharacterized protein involved in copper resistance